MNTVYLSQAEPLLRGAHAATIDQKQRDEIRAIHSRVLQFMRGTGIFIGEIPPDKTSAPSQNEPLTPDPACPHCEGKGYHGAMSVFDRCICTYAKTSSPTTCGGNPIGSAIMDEDDARQHDQKQMLATLEHNIACMVSDYEQGNIAGGRLRWAAIKADLRGQS